MNDLSYQLIVDKISKRHVDILLLLLESKKPISVPTLMDYCGVSRKTIKKDFDSFKEKFPASIQFTEYNDTTVIEFIEDPNAIEDYIDSLIASNPLFTVIEKSFFSEVETVESLAEDLFIADSTLRKYLNHLKIILKKYHLSLSLNPLQITGNEINIRYFYFSYFDQPSRVGKLKISLEQNIALYETIKALSTEYNNILNVEYHRLISWLTILENRLPQKKYVHFSEELYAKYSSDAAFLMLKRAIKHQFRGPVVGYMTEHELLFAYLILFDTIIYDRSGYFLVNDFFERLQPFQKLTTVFFRESKLDFGGNIDLKVLLQAFLANLEALTDLSSLFQKNDLQLKRLVENKYPVMLERWVSLLAQHTQFKYSYDVAVSLTALTISNIKRNKRVLLSLSGSPSAVNYYKMMVEKILPRDTEVFWNSNQPLDNSLVEKMKIDICICNFKPSTPLTYCQTFYISRIPLEIELDTLLVKLNKID